jgi:molybdopterin-guanine dinucleotide biosynthesis protein A
VTEFTGIILAGGKSSRMGSDKGLVSFNGSPLVTYSIKLLSHFCKEILISANNDAYQQFGFPVIKDEYPDKGPAGGLYSGLKAATNDWSIVVSCDVPFLSEELISYLITGMNNEVGVVPFYENKAEPLIALYHKSFQNILASNIQANHLKMQSIIRSSAIKLLEVKPVLSRFPEIFTNINFQEDVLNALK